MGVFLVFIVSIILVYINVISLLILFHFRPVVSMGMDRQLVVWELEGGEEEKHQKGLQKPPDIKYNVTALLSVQLEPLN